MIPGIVGLQRGSRRIGFRSRHGSRQRLRDPERFHALCATALEDSAFKAKA
jgi:hypothetical protein